MNYSKSLLLFQDKPEYGFILRLIFAIFPAALLTGSVYLLSSGEDTGAIVLLAEACLISLIFWFVLPRSYRVYEDHLCIVLGGPFSVKIRFVDIRLVEVTSRLNLNVNFVTKFTGRYVAIHKRTGFTIAITPKDGDLFVEHTNEALDQWNKIGK